MELHGLTAADFARMLNVSHATVSKLLNGDRGPSIELLMRISKVTGVKMDDFFCPDSSKKGRECEGRLLSCTSKNGEGL